MGRLYLGYLDSVPAGYGRYEAVHLAVELEVLNNITPVGLSEHP